MGTDVERLERAEDSISRIERNVDDLTVCIQQVTTGMAFLVARIARKEGDSSCEKLAGDATRQLCQLQQLLTIYEQKYPGTDSPSIGAWSQLLVPAGKN